MPLSVVCCRAGRKQWKSGGAAERGGECVLGYAVQPCNLQQRTLAHMYVSCPAAERQARGPGPPTAAAAHAGKIVREPAVASGAPTSGITCSAGREEMPAQGNEALQGGHPGRLCPLKAEPCPQGLMQPNGGWCAPLGSQYMLIEEDSCTDAGSARTKPAS